MSERAKIRERCVQRILGKIMMFKVAAKIVQRVGNGDQRSGSLILLLNVLFAVANNNADALEYMQLIGMSSGDFQLTFYILIERLSLCQRLLMGKNGISMLRR